MSHKLRCGVASGFTVFEADDVVGGALEQTRSFRARAVLVLPRVDKPVLAGSGVRDGSSIVVAVDPTGAAEGDREERFFREGPFRLSPTAASEDITRIIDGERLLRRSPLCAIGRYITGSSHPRV